MEFDMKKILSCLMICLTLFNLLSCAKANNPINPNVSNIPNIPQNDNQNTPQNVNDNQNIPQITFEDQASKPNVKIDISYLDSNYNVKETPTDRISMKINGIDNGFSIISEKAKSKKYTTIKYGDKEFELVEFGDYEYTVYFIDPKTGLVVSMTYENENLFPSIISFYSDEKIIIGETTRYNKDTQNFDVKWYMDNAEEKFFNIPLQNDISYFIPIKGLNSQANYQIRTIHIALQVWNAINKYVENRTTVITKSKVGPILSALGTIAAGIGVTVASLAGIITAAIFVGAFLLAGLFALIDYSIKKLKEKNDKVFANMKKILESRKGLNIGGNKGDGGGRICPIY